MLSVQEIVYEYLNSLDIFQQRDIAYLLVPDIVDGIKSKAKDLSGAPDSEITSAVENWLEDRCG